MDTSPDNAILTSSNLGSIVIYQPYPCDLYFLLLLLTLISYTSFHKLLYPEWLLSLALTQTELFNSSIFRNNFTTDFLNFKYMQGTKFILKLFSTYATAIFKLFSTYARAQVKISGFKCCFSRQWRHYHLEIWCSTILLAILLTLCVPTLCFVNIKIMKFFFLLLVYTIQEAWATQG